MKRTGARFNLDIYNKIDELRKEYSLLQGDQKFDKSIQQVMYEMNY